MSNYKGYLLKFGNTEFPNNYFAEYSSTPDQRMDNDAERDDNAVYSVQHCRQVRQALLFLPTFCT